MRTFAFLLFACTLGAQTGSFPMDYREVYYQSGKLRIQAYLYKPAGDGPFPVVIYNHGSRAGAEKQSRAFPFAGKMLTGAGYVVLVPERRGYGQSDGETFTDDVGAARGAAFVDRMQDETGDVLSSLELLKTLPYADRSRVAVMGWSLGGIVSVFAAARSTAFRAVIDQAGGSLTWDASPAMRKSLTDAAAKIRIPMLAQVARNDKTTHAVQTVAETAKRGGAAVKLIVYPEYVPLRPVRGTPPGHILFAADGAKIWREDVIGFLAGALAH